MFLHTKIHKIRFISVKAIINGYYRLCFLEFYFNIFINLFIKLRIMKFFILFLYTYLLVFIYNESDTNMEQKYTRDKKFLANFS